MTNNFRKTITFLTRFWNNLHQVCSNRKIAKPNNLKLSESNTIYWAFVRNRLSFISFVYFFLFWIVWFFLTNVWPTVRQRWAEVCLPTGKDLAGYFFKQLQNETHFTNSLFLSALCYISMDESNIWVMLLTVLVRSVLKPRREGELCLKLHFVLAILLAL
jgi:hypothetical protein